jgi:hypothetical protein
MIFFVGEVKKQNNFNVNKVRNFIVEGKFVIPT